MIHKLTIVCLTLVAMASCRDPFNPEIIDQNPQILVVEGYIEIAGDTSEIILSRTNAVRATGTVRRERGAQVSLVSSNGAQWAFAERTQGRYIYVGNFDPNDQYTLSIRLSDGSQYQSENLKPIITPEIEELGYFRDERGVEIYVSTKGSNDAQYFLWDYQEHWLFRTAYVSIFKYNEQTNQIDIRTQDERRDFCFKDNLFPRITLQNSARFSDNRIVQRELVRIPNFSEKLTRRYSILVRQRAIDQQTFDFWEILRRNSDDIGGIFSPLPSIIKSNINNVSGENKPTIGYISMGKSAKKRMYIDISEVFPWQVFIPEYDQCFIKSDTIRPPDYRGAFTGGIFVPVNQVRNENDQIIGYQGADVRCVDCTFRGTLTKPFFWED